MREILQLLFDMTFSTSVFILAILGIRFLFKNSSKNSRLLLWLLVGIKLLLPFNLESNFSLIPKTLFEKSTDNVGGVVSTVEILTSNVQETTVSYKSIFLIVWALGITIILIYGAVSFWRLHKNISDAVKKDGNLFQSEKVVSPFVLGIIKPKIYTPFNLDDETLSHIVSHEKSHIRNLDHITKLLAFVLLAVHWFNPLVWISFMLFTKDIELACDERVVKNYSLERRKSYAEALLNCAVNEGKGLIYPVAFGEVSVKDRIKSVVAYKKTLKTVLVMFLTVVLVVIVCFGTVPKASAKTVEKDAIPIVEETTTEAYVEEITTEPVTEEVTEPVTTTEIVEASVAQNNNSNEVYNTDEDYEFNVDDIKFENGELFSRAQSGSNIDEKVLVDPVERITEEPTTDFHSLTIPPHVQYPYENSWQTTTTTRSYTNISPTFPVINWDPTYY